MRRSHRKSASRVRSCIMATNSLYGSLSISLSILGNKGTTLCVNFKKKRRNVNEVTFLRILTIQHAFVTIQRISR